MTFRLWALNDKVCFRKQFYWPLLTFRKQTHSACPSLLTQTKLMLGKFDASSRQTTQKVRWLLWCTFRSSEMQRSNRCQSNPWVQWHHLAPCSHSSFTLLKQLARWLPRLLFSGNTHHFVSCFIQTASTVAAQFLLQHCSVRQRSVVPRSIAISTRCLAGAGICIKLLTSWWSLLQKEKCCSACLFQYESS